MARARRQIKRTKNGGQVQPHSFAATGHGGPRRRDAKARQTLRADDGREDRAATSRGLAPRAGAGVDPPARAAAVAAPQVRKAAGGPAASAHGGHSAHSSGACTAAGGGTGAASGARRRALLVRRPCARCCSAARRRGSVLFNRSSAARGPGAQEPRPPQGQKQGGGARGVRFCEIGVRDEAVRASEAYKGRGRRSDIKRGGHVSAEGEGAGDVGEAIREAAGRRVRQGVL